MKVDEFHKHINNIEASIKFTIEHETNNSIFFLECLLSDAKLVSCYSLLKSIL